MEIKIHNEDFGLMLILAYACTKVLMFSGLEGKTRPILLSESGKKKDLQYVLEKLKRRLGKKAITHSFQQCSRSGLLVY